jgi:hypothetical protein
LKGTLKQEHAVSESAANTGAATDSFKKLTDIEENTRKKLKNVQHEHAFEL